MGSSIGNFEPPEQRRFFRRLRTRLKPGDFLLIGFDHKKDPALLQSAYDDAQGVTRAFNRKLLCRLNRELDANFNFENFQHLASYNPATGSMEFWLMSVKDQRVQLPKIKLDLQFDA